jgi:hypothetical protein
MAQITYADKVALNVNPEIAAINKVQDTDMNEIKQVVNDNYNNTIQITNTQPTDSDNKIWIDTGEIGSAASEITNEYSTSTGIGYSANYVNNMNTYSTTEEIDTGKIWIDGKHIYRKVYSITNPSSSNTNYHDVSGLNIETLVNIQAPIISNIGYFVAPFQDSTDNYAVLFVNSANYLRGRFGTIIISGFVSCQVILEYTKTTD